MTCIAAVQHDGKVYIGGDSAGVADLSLKVRADEKVFINDDLLFGFTSSFRMGQLLRYSFTPPLHDPAIDDVTYMNTVFVDAVRECLKEGGFASKQNGVETGGTFLVGYRGQIYYVEDDYQIGIPADPFAAVGCGFDLALGALYSTPHLAPEPRLLNALAAAERFSAGVRAPFLVKSL